MANTLATVQELAPGMTMSDKTIVSNALDIVSGPVCVTTPAGKELGATALGLSHAVVVVEFSGVSRGSGGELYRLLSVHVPKISFPSV